MGGNYGRPTSAIAPIYENTSNGGYGMSDEEFMNQGDFSGTIDMNPGVNTGVGTGSGGFMDMFDGGKNGFSSSFMGQLPGYALGALSYLDQNKTNKLNRKATQYALDRKQTEDKAYDKYKSDWSNIKFA